MPSLLLFALPLSAFVLTLLYLLRFRAGAAGHTDKLYWKALNVPWSMVTVCSVMVFAYGVYQAEQRQQYDLAAWKVTVAREMALGFADASEAKWCSANSSDRRALLSLAAEGSLEDFCTALHALQAFGASATKAEDYAAVVARLSRVSHPMIPRHEVISVTLSTKKLAASTAQLLAMGDPWVSRAASHWVALAVAVLLAIAAAVRIATVHAEWRIQLAEDAMHVPAARDYGAVSPVVRVGLVDAEIITAPKRSARSAEPA
jgi:hypothetical protein